MDIIIPDIFYLSVLSFSGLPHGPKRVSEVPVIMSEFQLVRRKVEMPKGISQLSQLLFQGVFPNVSFSNLCLYT